MHPYRCFFYRSSPTIFSVQDPNAEMGLVSRTRHGDVAFVATVFPAIMDSIVNNSKGGIGLPISMYVNVNIIN